VLRRRVRQLLHVGRHDHARRRAPGERDPHRAVEHVRQPPSQTIPDVSYATFARQLGLGGITVDDPADLGAAWDEALAADRPTVLDVRTDPDFPPIPPHATLEQVRNTAKALLHGDEDARGVLSSGLRTKVRELLPHRKAGD
jgi:pyruvate dehydrogenase (quinone)